DDLGRLPFAVALSRRSAAIIRQNLTVALVIVAGLVPATLIGLPIGPAVFIHEGSTLLVVANALRLLRFRRGQEHAGIEHEARPA
ncbi:heavy metal translocating P-type ATPase, partial [Nocardia sp. NPDC004722]